MVRAICKEFEMAENMPAKAMLDVQDLKAVILFKNVDGSFKNGCFLFVFKVFYFLIFFLHWHMIKNI